MNNSRVLRLEPNSTSPNFIAGYSGNSVTAGVFGATIGGGGTSSVGINRVTDHYGTVSGGRGNRAGDGDGDPADATYATVGGGYLNYASGSQSTIGGGRENSTTATYATVGGGYSNEASGASATVGGGVNNTASGETATVCGGDNNTASGWSATVAGGENNTAAGDNSFAAGYRARANSTGCFVWGDSTYADVSCNVANRWVARASGGVYFYTNPGLTSGVYVASGGNSWNAVSNRALKENFEPVDTQALLERLVRIEITTWNYKSQDPAIRHIGPMAEDFNALVNGLGGEGQDYINSLDADGVALAAIQGLYSLVQEKDARIAELEERVAALEAWNVAQQAQIDDLEARLTALEQRAGDAPASASIAPSLSGLVMGGLAIVGAVALWREWERGKR